MNYFLKKVDEHYYILSEDNVDTGKFVLLPSGKVKQMTDTDMLDYLASESLATKVIVASTQNLGILPLIDREQIYTAKLNHYMNEFYSVIEKKHLMSDEEFKAKFSFGWQPNYKKFVDEFLNKLDGDILRVELEQEFNWEPPTLFRMPRTSVSIKERYNHVNILKISNIKSK